jgi:hypothetical protein
MKLLKKRGVSKMANNANALIPDEAIEAATSVKKHSLKRTDRLTAALGNMRAHLWIDSNKPVWVTVDKGDLEEILAYVEALEERVTKQATLVKIANEFAEDAKAIK